MEIDNDREPAGEDQLDTLEQHAVEMISARFPELEKRARIDRQAHEVEPGSMQRAELTLESIGRILKGGECECPRRTGVGRGPSQDVRDPDTATKICTLELLCARRRHGQACSQDDARAPSH